jgi:DNA-binding transcriptional LysR family regulator
LLALQFIQGSDLIGALPTRMIPPEVSRQFAFLEPPIPLEPFPLYLIRHRRSDDDAAVRFVALALADQISPASGLDGSA